MASGTDVTGQGKKGSAAERSYAAFFFIIAVRPDNRFFKFRLLLIRDIFALLSEFVQSGQDGDMVRSDRAI